MTEQQRLNHISGLLQEAGRRGSEARLHIESDGRAYAVLLGEAEAKQLEFDFDRYYCRRPEPCLCSNCTALL